MLWTRPSNHRKIKPQVTTAAPMPTTRRAVLQTLSKPRQSQQPRLVAVGPWRTMTRAWPNRHGGLMQFPQTTRKLPAAPRHSEIQSLSLQRSKPNPQRRQQLRAHHVANCLPQHPKLSVSLSQRASMGTRATKLTAQTHLHARDGGNAALDNSLCADAKSCSRVADAPWIPC